MASSFAVLLLIICQISSLVSAFYSDNGVDQTVYFPKISKRERREMQQEILTLLGLDHRPKPSASVATDTSAPRYMLDLYKNLIDSETGELIANESTHIDPKLWHDDNSLHAIYDADIIMSFVNHGRHRRRKCRRVSNPLRFKSQTNRPVCTPRNSTNDRPAHEKAHLRHDKDRRFWFDLSEVPVGETLIGCELRLYKESGRPNKKSNFQKDLEADTNYTLAIYEITQGHDPEDKELKLVDSVNVTFDYEGWVYLNVSGPANNWLIFPETNLGLFLRIHVEGKAKELHPKDINLVGGKGRHDRQPFMVAFFKMTQDLHIRRTREAKRRQRTDISYNDADTWTGYSSNTGMDLEAVNKRSCQKRILFVSFKELNWQDWIIAPDGYAAFYCSGECSFPLNAHMNATNHAIVQTLVHLMSPYEYPKPCCAPTKLSAISVLFFDDNSNVILKKYKNMVVKSCGCH